MSMISMDDSLGKFGATIRDIAKAVGVSYSACIYTTVAKALKNDPRISSEPRRKVQEVTKSSRM